MTVTDNVTLVGNVSLNNHVLGNFSTSNYAYNSFVPHLPDYNSWEISAKITTSSGYVTSIAYVILDCGDLDSTYSRNCGFILRIYENKINLIVARYTNSYQDVVDLRSDTIQDNTEYIVKARFTGSRYELEVNGAVVAYKDATWRGLYNASRMPHLDIGIHTVYIGTSDNPWPFTGTIDLNGCYFIADGNILWQGVERSKTYYNPARKTSGFYIPARKKSKTIINSSLLTVQQATISSDNILTTQSSNNYSFARTTERMPLDTADTWEWRTKVTRTGGGSSNYPAIIAHSNSNYCSAPYIQVIVSESGKAPYSVDIVIPTSSSNYIGNGAYNHVLTQNTPYYFKFGFTGTEYYLSGNTTGWDDPFEDWARYSSTTKCYVAPNTVTEFLGRYTAGSIQGNMDLNETRLYINGQVYWECTTNKIVNDFYIPSRKDNS